MVDFLFLLLQVFTLLLIGRALFSWFDPGLRTTVGRFLYEATEPVVGPVRQVLPSTGMFDLSIFVTLILLQVLRSILQSYLVN